jgi:hypothetical protein
MTVICSFPSLLVPVFASSMVTYSLLATFYNIDNRGREVPAGPWLPFWLVWW